MRMKTSSQIHQSSRHKPGDKVVCITDYREPQPGIVKALGCNGITYFVWYHSGCTAAGTPPRLLRKPTKKELEELDWSNVHSGCDQCF